MLQDIEFIKEEGRIRAVLLKKYYFYIDEGRLAGLGSCSIKDKKLIIPEKKLTRLHYILEEGLKNLTGPFGKKTIYVHKNSGIPLIGTNEFGLVDRDTNIIEVKPNNGCNLNCIFCSVAEGQNDHKSHDFLVEEEYLVEEFEKLAAQKKHKVQACINPQGEPLLYPKIIELVRDLKMTKNVEVVSINTNGTLLSKVLIDKLAAAGLDRLNVSLNAMDKDVADRMEGRSYPLDHVLKMIEYAKGRTNVLIAPVIVPGINDSQVEKLILFAEQIKSKYPVLGFQNYLHYKKGRRTVKERSFDDFFRMLHAYEEKHRIMLTPKPGQNPFGIFDDKTLRKPFRKGEVIEAEIKCPGRFENERIAAAQNRCITVMTEKDRGRIRIKIIRDKHNVFKGILT